MREKILKNAAECKLCHDVIESTHVHDFRSCKCGEINVDGGREYLRRGARDLSNIIERSEVEEQPVAVWLAEAVAKTKNVSHEIKMGLRWGATLNLTSAIRDEVSGLTLEQFSKIEKIILRELTGDK